MLRKALPIAAGIGVSIGLLFATDFPLYDEIQALMGKNPALENDYLNVSSELPLESRRAEFANKIRTNGPSFRVALMICESNFETFENEAKTASFGYNLEMEILEKKFRKFYPELFDEQSGREFIESLHLKTKCNDYGMPTVGKPN